MFNMFNQFFTMLSTLFSAGEKACRSLDVLAGSGLMMAETHAEEIRLESAKKLKALRAEVQQ